MLLCIVTLQLLEDSNGAPTQPIYSIVFALVIRALDDALEGVTKHKNQKTIGDSLILSSLHIDLWKAMVLFVAV